ncbi:multicopper oxidase domain-containing protein [Amycolatopsis sp. NPDC051061]|uniref:multicopper oxidase domain-containing protein n=1 Tax=Amycolatopsis sp. NPDC051061 TaxID=3155042 RepID=UPI003443A73A
MKQRSTSPARRARGHGVRRLRRRRLPGRYMFPCHNAEHEDMGMMATFETT